MDRQSVENCPSSEGPLGYFSRCTLRRRVHLSKSAGRLPVRQAKLLEFLNLLCLARVRAFVLSWPVRTYNNFALASPGNQTYHMVSEKLKQALKTQFSQSSGSEDEVES